MTKKGVLKEVRNAVRLHYGKGEDEKVNRLGHPIFNLEMQYIIEEENYLNCTESNSFELVKYLQDYMTGSKIVFQQATMLASFWQTPSNGSGIYFLVGVLLNRRDGTTTDVIELSLENGEQAPNIKIQPVDELIA